MRYDWQRLKADLTGRWAFDPKGFLVFTPLYFLFSVLLGTKYSQPDSAFAALGANAISLSACAVVYAAFYFTVFRNRLIKPVNINLLVIAGLLLGFTKGYVTGLMMWLFGVDPSLSHSVSTRVYSTSILGIFVVLTQPLMLSLRERFKHQRNALVVERVKLSSTPKDDLQSFANLARRQLSTSDEGSRGNAGFLRSSELLRRIIQEDLRPLSHRIWEQENARYTDFSLSNLYRLAVTKFALPWRYVAPTYFITAFGSFYPKWPLSKAIMMDLAVTLSIVAIFAFAKLFVPNRTAAASIYTCLVVSIATYLGGTMIMVLFGLPLDAELIASNIGNALWVLELTLGGALITAAVKSHVEIEQELIKLVGAAAARKDSEMLGSRIANRELAQYLHGHVQNQLLAAAIRIEQAEASNDDDGLKQELALVDQVLATAPEGFRTNGSTSLESEMKNIEKLWQGLLIVTITVDTGSQNLRLTQNLLHDLTQAANEAITNAARHGFASEVKVSIIASNGHIELTATDNGTGPRSGGVGLGSALYSSLAGDRWALSPAVGGGSVLSLKIRV